MKIVLLCAFVLACSTVACARESVLLPCLQNAGASIGDIPSLLSDTSDEGIRKRGCIEACVMQNANLMNGNVIDLQRIDETIDQIVPENENREQIRQTVHQCAENAVSDDQCMVAQQFARCGLGQLRLGIQQILPGLSI